jgi:hypothetical protein
MLHDFRLPRNVPCALSRRTATPYAFVTTQSLK